VNISDLISFNDVLSEDMDDKMRALVTELIVRLENFRVMMIDQLRAQPDVYFADPTTPEGMAATEGAKQGDIAVWRGSDGMDHWMILGMPPPQAAATPPVGANLTTDKVSLLLEGGGANGYYIRDGRLTLI